jgi:FG-GAP-like repeat
MNTGAWAGLDDDPPAVVDGYNPLSIFIGGSTSGHVVGMGDFTGDGHTDLLVRDVSNGGLWVWGMLGALYMTPHYVGTVDLEWAVEGVGDFDGDQQEDILWRNHGSGEVVVWFMAGREIVRWRSISSARVDWHIEGVADFNADGQSDILWRNHQTGTLGIWLMRSDLSIGGTPSVALPPAPDLNWTIVAVADFDHDGMADILWNYVPNGFLGAWILKYTPSDGLKVRWDLDGTLLDSTANAIHTGSPLTLPLLRTLAAPR